MLKMASVLLALLASLAEAAPNNVTSIKTEHFAIQLPGSWSELGKNEPGLWQYGTASQGEQLSVSVLKLAEPTEQKNLSLRLNEFLNARLKAEREQAHGAHLELSTPELSRKVTAWSSLTQGSNPIPTGGLSPYQ